MRECNHAALELLPSRKRALRCRQCHLTLDVEEAGDGHCPECFERTGKRYSDFEELESSDGGAIAYRCEDCGVIIRCP
jgi:hypothetical protein